ncbi:unnamed protein product [Gadus morhua 'NCC']
MEARLALEAVGGGKTRKGAALQMLKGTEATQSEVPAVAVSGRCRDQPAPRPGKVRTEEQMAVQLPWWRDPEYDDRTVDLQRWSYSPSTLRIPGCTYNPIYTRHNHSELNNSYNSSCLLHTILLPLYHFNILKKKVL